METDLQQWWNSLSDNWKINFHLNKEQDQKYTDDVWKHFQPPLLNSNKDELYASLRFEFTELNTIEVFYLPYQVPVSDLAPLQKLTNLNFSIVLDLNRKILIF